MGIKNFTRKQFIHRVMLLGGALAAIASSPLKSFGRKGRRKPPAYGDPAPGTPQAFRDLIEQHKFTHELGTDSGTGISPDTGVPPLVSSDQSFSVFTKPEHVMHAKSSSPLSPLPGVDNAKDFDDRDVYHGIAPEYDVGGDHKNARGESLFPAGSWPEEKHVEMHAVHHVTEIIKGVATPCFAYQVGSHPSFPGPTYLVEAGEALVVRTINDLHDVEISTHQHGGCVPSHADGYPDFWCLPGKIRDYFYPNVVHRELLSDGSESDQFDESYWQSTMWYHDHSMDITGFTVAQGLAGYYLMVDPLERGLMESGVLPNIFENEYGIHDIPLVIQDTRLNEDGSIHYDFLDHAGRLGDIFMVNGKASPRLTVQPRKYRFRMLNGSNARVYMLRLSDGGKFLQIGKDSYMLPNAFGLDEVMMMSGERTDLIVDFSKYSEGEEVYLENWMEQTDGRGPDGVGRKAQQRLIKFVVKGTAQGNISVEDGTELRPHVGVLTSGVPIAGKFEWKTDRKNGAWTVNGELFNPLRSDVEPVAGTVQRWFVENKSGGWWHPFHIHLTGSEINKRPRGDDLPSVKERERFDAVGPHKVDMIALANNTRREINVRLQTFDGPFVLHCHTVEHEDMRMMAVMDVRTPGTDRHEMDGEEHIPSEISGMPEDFHADGFFEHFGDVGRLIGRGVGFDHLK
ncbi:MAG: multicopper oxidase domain-containing protein [Deltaproteobacteria bacterium]|nr:multicopper oxidase domain-containing protein [Deltaproteobacteria bacterium]